MQNAKKANLGEIVDKTLQRELTSGSLLQPGSTRLHKKKISDSRFKNQIWNQSESSHTGKLTAIFFIEPVSESSVDGNNVQIKMSTITIQKHQTLVAQID